MRYPGFASGRMVRAKRIRFLSKTFGSVLILREDVLHGGLTIGIVNVCLNCAIIGHERVLSTNRLSMD